MLLSKQASKSLKEIFNAHWRKRSLDYSRFEGGMREDSGKFSRKEKIINIEKSRRE